MRIPMHALRGVLVGRVHEAEGGAPLLVKPASDEFYSILILDFESLRCASAMSAAVTPFIS
jgi:hypothetical protein